MSNIEPNHKSDYPDLSTQQNRKIKKQTESALQQADLRISRSVSLVDGQKCPQRGETDHHNPSNHRRPSVIDGNCSLHTGDGLLAIDIDNHDALPNEIRSRLPSTYAIQTPHGGEHILYQVPDDTDISSADLPNNSGDLQYDHQYILCPGSYVDHSHCNDGKHNCPGCGIDWYLPKNDQPIATITESEHPELLQRICKLDSGHHSKSASGSTPSISEQDLIDSNLDNGESQYRSFYQILHDEAGNAARQTIHDIIRGEDANIIDSCSDSTIDRSKSDYYVIKRLYGAFLYRGDCESDARKNAVDVFKYFVHEYPYHSDGQKRKLDTVSNQKQYLNNIIDDAQRQFDFGKWLRWFNWEQKDNDYTFSGTASRLTKATVLAAIEYLTSLGSSQLVSIESLQRHHRADFKQLTHKQAIDQLSTYPSAPPRYSSPYPPGRTARSTDQPDQVRASSGNEWADEKAIDRMFPTRSEIEQMAYMLNPEREPATFADAVSELVNDPEPLETVVQAYCPSRTNGNRYVYYVQRQAHSDSDPKDAEWVKLEDRKFEPITRKPISGNDAGGTIEQRTI